MFLLGAVSGSVSAQRTSSDFEFELSVESTLVSPGSEIEVSWAAPWADDCIASGAWIGPRAATGTETVSIGFDNNELVLTCSRGGIHSTEKIEFVVMFPMVSIGLSAEPKPYIVVDVFFATDRARVETSDGYWFDRADWSQSMSYGRAEVSIPEVHRPGELESPVWWKLQFRENPRRHVVLRSYEERSEQDFYSELSVSADETVRKEAFIFVHGFNVELEDALRRTAQLAFDLRLDAVPVTYSWPSKGAGIATSYTTAENNALKSVDHFKQFIEEIRQQSTVNTVNILAHSMGNRIVVDALHELGEGGDVPWVTQVLLAAPDIDVELFESEIVPALSAAKSTTFYSSSGDKALAVSEDIHGEKRAGSVPLIVDGMDTIDSSGLDLGVLGHSYYADKLLQDIFYVIHHQLPAAERNLVPAVGDDGTYWTLPQ